jgi:rhamnosyl/mannosyltransferase
MEAAGIRARYGPRIVISVGRLVYYKGLEYLIRAMAMVNGRLLIVGDGPLRHDLERKAQARGVGERVVFVGKVPDVVPYYQAGDVFVLASIARSEAGRRRVQREFTVELMAQRTLQLYREVLSSPEQGRA